MAAADDDAPDGGNDIPIDGDDDDALINVEPAVALLVVDDAAGTLLAGVSISRSSRL